MSFMRPTKSSSMRTHTPTGTPPTRRLSVPTAAAPRAETPRERIQFPPAPPSPAASFSSASEQSGHFTKDDHRLGDKKQFPPAPPSPAASFSSIPEQPGLWRKGSMNTPEQPGHFRSEDGPRRVVEFLTVPPEVGDAPRPASVVHTLVHAPQVAPPRAPSRAVAVTLRLTALRCRPSSSLYRRAYCVAVTHTSLPNGPFVVFPADVADGGAVLLYTADNSVVLTLSEPSAHDVIGVTVYAIDGAPIAGYALVAAKVALERSRVACVPLYSVGAEGPTELGSLALEWRHAGTAPPPSFEAPILTAQLYTIAVTRPVGGGVVVLTHLGTTVRTTGAQTVSLAVARGCPVEVFCPMDSTTTCWGHFTVHDVPPHGREEAVDLFLMEDGGFPFTYGTSGGSRVVSAVGTSVRVAYSLVGPGHGTPVAIDPGARSAVEAQLEQCYSRIRSQIVLMMKK